MVLGRLPFVKGNAVPAVLMSVNGRVGLVRHQQCQRCVRPVEMTLLHIGPLLALVLIVLLQTGLAFFGHNLVQASSAGRSRFWR